MGHTDIFFSNNSLISEVTTSVGHRSEQLWSQLRWRMRQEDQLSPGVWNQPGKPGLSKNNLKRSCNPRCTSRGLSVPLTHRHVTTGMLASSWGRSEAPKSLSSPGPILPVYSERGPPCLNPLFTGQDLMFILICLEGNAGHCCCSRTSCFAGLGYPELKGGAW